MHRNPGRALKNAEGSVLIIAGIWFLVLVAVGGAGFDFARRELVRLKLQQATDAAALAGALMASGATEADRRAEVLRYYRLNFPDTYLGIARPSSPSITINTSVTVSGNVDVPTSFIENLGIEKLPARGRSVVTIGAKSIDFDLVMVVDESASNRGRCPDCGSVPRIVKLRDAVVTMMNSVFGDTTNPNMRVGLIGYSGRVIDKWGLTSNKAQAIEAANSIGMVNENYDHYGMQAAYNMITGRTSGDITSGKQAAELCGTNNPPETQGWMAEPPPRGPGLSPTVLIDNGINWNWPPCTPRADARVPDPRTARPDGRAVSSVKNVVFITDGFIMYEPPPCSPTVPYGTGGCPNYRLFLNECDQMKRAGVTIFTINYVSRAPGDEATLRSCASDDPVTGQPRYFFAPDSATLDSVLRDIGTTIKKVRIAE